MLKKAFCMMIMLLVSALMMGTRPMTTAVVTPSIAILPSPQTFDIPAVNTTFTVSCTLSNMADLYGVDIQVGWEPEYIRYVSRQITIPVETYPDGILHKTTLNVRDQVDETASMPDSEPETMYWFSEASMAPAPAFNGNGTAFVMTFRIVYNASAHASEPDVHTHIHFFSVTLASSAGIEITHDEFDGEIIIENPGHVYPPEPLLKISPTNYHPAYNSPFDVNIPLMDVLHGDLSPEWDVAGFDFMLTYNSTLVHGLGVTVDPDGWFASFWPGGVFTVKNETDDATGLAWICFLGIPGDNRAHTPVRGQGRIAVVHFNATCQLPPSSTVQVFLLNIIDATITGFPHPEIWYPPWNGLECSVSLPCNVQGVPYLIGDVNYDGVVNILDIVDVTSIYDCKEGERNWNPEADLAAPYGKIDILDLVTITCHYGQKYP